MSALPGSLGYTLLGDKSVEFYRDPKKFIQNKIDETSSKVFQSRLLNKPTVFICSYKETHELLNEKSDDFDNGYHDFLFNSYGNNILFENGDTAAHLKMCMEPVFRKTPYYEGLIERTCSALFVSLSKQGSCVNVYEEFKALMTRLCLELFLGSAEAAISSELYDSISKWTTLHWHGIISMPVSVKIPFAGESGWRKALQAKEELLKHIRATISHKKEQQGHAPCTKLRSVSSICDTSSTVEQMLSAPFKNKCTEVEQHMLLFISALIPKAFASIITSFILELSGENNADLRERSNSDPEFHKRTLLEVQRLWPPFFGGRRIANKDTVIGTYRIPKGYAVVYISYFAHRDDNVFANPETFDPDRWLDGDLCSSCQQLFTFGNGKRQCLGTHLIQHILTYITKHILENFSWCLLASQDPSFVYKLLPVTRPDTLPLIDFKKKS